MWRQFKILSSEGVLVVIPLSLIIAVVRESLRTVQWMTVTRFTGVGESAFVQDGEIKGGRPDSQDERPHCGFLVIFSQWPRRLISVFRVSYY